MSPCAITPSPWMGSLPGHGIGTSSHDRSPGEPVLPFLPRSSATRRPTYSVGTWGSLLDEAAKPKHHGIASIPCPGAPVNSIGRIMFKTTWKAEIARDRSTKHPPLSGWAQWPSEWPLYGELWYNCHRKTRRPGLRATEVAAAFAARSELLGKNAICWQLWSDRMPPIGNKEGKDGHQGL